MANSYIPILPVGAPRGKTLDDLAASHNAPRRQFLKAMAASMALAGAGCSGPPQEVIVPYVEMPEMMTLGRPLFYASAFSRRGCAQGVLIESNMGRPTKIEGNPLHPGSLGATDVFTQAAILQLWDPDRSQTPSRAGRIAPWQDFENALLSQAALWDADGGAGLRILTGSIDSPTLAAQIRDLLKRYPQAKWHRCDPLHDDRGFEAARLAFGRPADAVYRTDAAALIVTLDADLFGDWPGAIPYARGFTAARSGAAPVFDNRLYAVECTPSITGAAADNRLALSPPDIARLARRLAMEIGMPGGADDETNADAGVAAEVDADVTALIAAWSKTLARQLKAQRGRCLLVAGGAVDVSTRALVHAMNAWLGNEGKTVRYIAPIEEDACNHGESIAALSAEMQAGRVSALIMAGVNPVYNAPADLAFADGLAKVAFSVHLGLYQDETGEKALWHLPQTHPCEAWSDGRAYDGTHSIVQPAIAPLYGGRSAHQLLAMLMPAGDTGAYALVRRYWQDWYTRNRHEKPHEHHQDRGGGDGADGGNGGFEAFWETALQQGLVAGSASAALALRAKPVALPRSDDTASRSTARGAEPHRLSAVFRADPATADGEFSNSGWLQELPRPLTQLTWDNAAMIGAATAAALALQTGDIVTLSAGAAGHRVEVRVEAPVMVMSEHAEGVVTLPLGYGRRAAGRVGNGVGFDAYALRGKAALLGITTLSLTKTGRAHRFAVTQGDDRMEGRDLIPLASAAQFRRQPDFASAEPRQRVPEATLYPNWEYKDYKWGMAIDLNACIGCNVCTIACQAENNIPVVGKEEVMRGRRMHWIRVDRYRSGSGSGKGAGKAGRDIFQPVPCMHCENAPCEEVCPVGATVHDSEGLNVQVYNRCVGTRFCSNNCPYKVRRFNFLQYANVKQESLKALQNPEVTVRRRGVMEKCTYCLQRITRARTGAEQLGRTLRDGEVVTACQAACPTGAIVFGNLNDPGSAVNRAKRSPLDYALLAELNTRPRTTYAARVVNDDPELS